MSSLDASFDEGLFIAITSKDHLDLAFAEISHVFDVTPVRLMDGVFLFSYSFLKCSKEDFLIKISRLGFLKYFLQVYSQLNSADELIDASFDFILRPYKVQVYTKTGFSTEKEKQYSAIVHKSRSSIPVCLSSPQQRCFFVETNDVLFVCDSLFVNLDSGQDRKAHVRKYNHPTSVHPKIAKAMINLVDVPSFYDPFCGAGGLLIEGAKMGLHVQGSDIDPIMIKRAKQNLEALQLYAHLEIKDALSISGTYDAIITDLPFGKNSRLDFPFSELLDLFLARASITTSHIVLGFEKQVEEVVYQTALRHGLCVTFVYSYYIHKSMTRCIALLESVT